MCKWGNTVPVEVLVPADLSYTGKPHTKLAQIDRCIADIIVALNQAGIFTRTSCCGHGKRDGEIVLEDGRTLRISRCAVDMTQPTEVP